MRPKMSRLRQAGLTMIEVAIASLILAAIVAMSSWLVWQSSDAVASAEAALKLESQARDVIEALVRELRQTKMTSIRKIEPSTILVSPSAFNPVGNPPVPGSNALVTPNPPVNQTFNAIRFRLPGPTMDLTKKNAEYVSTDPVKKNNFDMKKFQTSQDTAWSYEVMYWWEVEHDEGATGTGPNGKVPDGTDNNWNGIVDEGSIKKIESWYDTAGVLVRRVQSVVCRDVKYDNVAALGGLKFTIPSTDVVGTAYPAGSEKSIRVSLTLQKRDPRYPKDSKRLIEKTVTTTIDVRN